MIQKTSKMTMAFTAILLALTACSPSLNNRDPNSGVTNSGESNNAAQPQSSYLKRDVREDVFYFVMPDRFNNGDVSNDSGAPKGSISHGGLDTTSKWAFHGGDMAGIEQKLDYLKSMGITAIWMTPILRNKAVQKGGFAHHGYWIVDFTEIDPHFGSNADLKRLIDTAHKKDIKVFFDIITNHTADVIKYEECHNADGSFKSGLDQCTYHSLQEVKEQGTYRAFVPEKEQGEKFPEWLNDPRFYHNQGDTTFEGENSLYGDFNGLDDINTEDPEVVKGMIDIYTKLISEFKPDGFRIDTVRHVQLPFWQAFSPAIMAHAKAEGIENFHVFGEVYDPNPEALSSFTTEGKLPAVLDFGFQSAVGGVFFEDKPVSTIETLIAQDHLYNDEDSNVNQLLTFLGNHDMGRPGFFLNKHLPNASNEEKLQRSMLAHAMMFFSRGVPVVYYGDEQGFTGDGNDVDAREDMMPSKVASYNDNTLLGTKQTTKNDNFNSQHPLYKSIAEYAAIRKQQPLLQYGVQENKFFDDKKQVFAFARVANDTMPNGGVAQQNDEALLVVFNVSAEQQTVTVSQQYESYLVVSGAAKISASDNGETQITLPAFSFGLFSSK